jgi:hypothetical protein
MPPPRDDLRLLSIFHYVLAGLTALFSLFPLLYVGMGAFFISGVLKDEPNPPPAFIGWFIIAIGAFFFLLILAEAVALFFAGRFLAQQRHWLFCMIVAGLSCASFPFGTALGVFTIVVLSKPEVKALFTVQQTSVFAG